jgi:hypothetical protein
VPKCLKCGKIVGCNADVSVHSENLARVLLEIFRFLEWMMALPESLQQTFKVELKSIEEEKPMTFITSFERDALIEGGLLANRKAIVKVLEIRFVYYPVF